MFYYLPFLSSIVPALILLYIFYSQDRYPEPTGMIFKTFIIGVVLCFPAGYLNNLAIDWIETSQKLGRISNESAIFYDSLIPGALIEECLKFLVLYFYCFKSEHLDERIDALVYGTTISLGFATLENYHYVMRADDFGLTWSELAWMRAFTAVPAHAMWGIIMGYFLYNYKEHKLKSFTLALGVPITLHMLYNASYFSYLLVLFVSLMLTISFVSKSKRLQNINPWLDLIEDDKSKLLDKKNTSKSTTETLVDGIKIVSKNKK